MCILYKTANTKIKKNADTASYYLVILCIDLPKRLCQHLIFSKAHNLCHLYYFTHYTARFQMKYIPAGTLGCSKLNTLSSSSISGTTQSSEVEVLPFFLVGDGMSE